MHHSRLNRIALWAIVTTAVCLVVPARGAAQRYGQWWWQSSVGVEQRVNETFRDGRQSSYFEIQGLRLDGDLKGFVLHPAIGSFRLHLDLLISKLEGGRYSASDKFGWQGDLQMFPRGKYPFRLFASQQAYGYKLPKEADPFTLAREIESYDQWGGNIRFRSGFFRGVRLVFDASQTDFLDPSVRQDRHDNQAVSWERDSGGVRHRFRFARKYREVGSTDLDEESITAHIDEKGTIGGDWVWLLNGLGLRRRLTVRDLESDFQDYRLKARTTGRILDRDLLEFVSEVGWSQLDSREPVERYSLIARYRWNWTPKIQLAPFIRYVKQSFGGGSLSSPRAGVSLVWSATTGGFDSVVDVSSSYGMLSSEEPNAKVRESDFDAAFSARIGHGSNFRLRKELDLTVTRNVLNSTLSLAPRDNLDLEVVRAVGGQDRATLRFTLSQSRSQRDDHLWVEWSRSESEDAFFGGSLKSDSLSVSANRGTRRFRFSANLGRNEVIRETKNDQEIFFFGGSVTWRPLRILSVQAVYRSDRQASLLTPDINSELKEILVQLPIALLELELRAFESDQVFIGESTRTNRGFSWSIRRRFAGLLPIVSAPQRRGVIR